MNFGGLRRGPLEPLQLLLDQWHAREAGTPIQTGRPAGIHLEPRQNILRAADPRSGIPTVNAVPFSAGR